MFTYKVEYLTNPGSWSIMIYEYKCEAWTKWGAWKKWLEATKDEPHYSSHEYMNSYWKMREDIKRI